MEIVEEDRTPLMRVFVFGLEAIIALSLGTFFLCCNTVILWKTHVIERLFAKLGDLFPFLRLLGFRKKPPVEVAPRIYSEECSICFGDIRREVSSTCGHIFCGKLI